MTLPDCLESWSGYNENASFRVLGILAKLAYTPGKLWARLLYDEAEANFFRDLMNCADADDQASLRRVTYAATSQQLASGPSQNRNALASG